jgi:hypothetical protein
LLDNKLDKLQETKPDMIVSANIGCLMHLQSGTKTPVRHWIELLDQGFFPTKYMIRCSASIDGDLFLLIAPACADAMPGPSPWLEKWH